MRSQVLLSVRACPLFAGFSAMVVAIVGKRETTDGRSIGVAREGSEYEMTTG